mmetsp:Transcript_31186/g.64215  ORF Transcript_31186/g.64215 Transcript_31186/m.64215 type:complete len:315 (-) Transcript_31186:390-1334(-)
MLRSHRQENNLALAVIIITIHALLTSGTKAFTSTALTDRRVLDTVYRSTSSNVEDGIVTMVDDMMVPTYESLAARLIDRYNNAVRSKTLKNNQLFVCVAGGPGAGKSTLAGEVCRRINEKRKSLNHLDGRVDPAVVLPMDGFHYTRAELRAMGESPDVQYTYDELIARRGAPWTFDAEGCIAAFTAARERGWASLPIYSRVKSDPVPDGVTLHPETKIVLLEGNYLLAWDDKRWAPLKTNHVFDETWYISCKSLDEQRERLVKRHLETWSEEKSKMWGDGREGAGAKADANDMLNLMWIDQMSKQYADLEVESV